MDCIKGLVHEVGVLEETDIDFYNKHDDNIACDECLDGGDFCQSE